MFLRIKLLTILCIMGFLFTPAAFCAEEEKPEPDKEEEQVFTQGQLAVAIVRSLGLENEIGFDQSVLAYANFVDGRGIRPLGGWDVNAPVTKEVLAVVVVQTLGLRSEVQDPANVADYITVLEDRDISIEDVRKVLSNIFVVNVITDIVGPSVPEDGPLTPIAGF